MTPGGVATQTTPADSLPAELARRQDDLWLTPNEAVRCTRRGRICMREKQKKKTKKNPRCFNKQKKANARLFFKIPLTIHH